nr:MAG TPA: hypothetical protein [Caudoviricetes sp.]
MHNLFIIITLANAQVKQFSYFCFAFAQVCDILFLI